ncbi:hypothetical protein ABPG77_000900 [Micractinium sp. CCAP 211/92]
MSLAAQQREWENEQEVMATQVVRRDDGSWLRQPGGWAAHLTLVGGLDISFFPASSPTASPPAELPSAAGCPIPAAAMQQSEGEAPPPSAPERAVAALAVLSFPGLEVQHVELLELPALGAPYLPGFLGFREVPAYLELLRRAAAKGVHPQLLLVDGTGVLHPRRCGSASHLGVLSGLPTVGVAKTLLQVDGLPGEREVRAAVAAALDAQAQLAPRSESPEGPEALQPGDRGCSARADGADGHVYPLPGSGCWLPLLGPHGEELGAAQCAGGASSSNRASSGQPASRRPIFVSVGHRLGLATALAVVQRCCIHRVPEPIRQADLLSRAEVRRRHLGSAAETVPAAAAAISGAAPACRSRSPARS